MSCLLTAVCCEMGRPVWDTSGLARRLRVCLVASNDGPCR